MENELYQTLIDYQIATKEEIQLVTYINGWKLESLESILYCRTGNRSLEQFLYEQNNC